MLLLLLVILFLNEDPVHFYLNYNTMYTSRTAVSFLHPVTICDKVSHSCHQDITYGQYDGVKLC